MSGRVFVNNSSQTHSASGDFASEPFKVKWISSLGVQVLFSDAASAGAIWLEISADSPESEPTNWVAVDRGTGSELTVSGNTEPYFWDYPDIGGSWIRVVFDRSAGAGTATITFNAKGAL